MTDTEKNHKYVHAGYQYMKLGKRIMEIGEQLVNENKSEKTLKGLLNAAVEESGNITTIALKTRTPFTYRCIMLALSTSVFLFGLSMAVKDPLQTLEGSILLASFFAIKVLFESINNK